MGLSVQAVLGAETGQVVGYYANRRRREGETFEIKEPKDFSARWMKPIGWDPKGGARPMPTSDVIVEATQVNKPESVETKAEARARRRRERDQS